MSTKQSRERGQALIIIVLAFTALIAMVGLTVDGGYALAERRHAQNTSDAAALAGALAKVKALDGGLPMTVANDQMRAAALGRASSNGFDNDGIDNIVEVYSPPISGPYADCGTSSFNCNNYVQVIIQSHTQAFFSKVIGIERIDNQVEATSLAQGPDNGPLFGGNAIVALNPSSSNCSGDLVIGGSGVVTVTGGGMFVNSDNPDCAFVQDGCNVTLDATEGGITSVGGINLNDNCTENITGGQTTDAEQYPYPPEYTPEEPPECAVAGTVANKWPVAGVTTLYPGWYDKLPPNAATQGIVVMSPGNYCVNQVLKTTGSTTSLTGTGVFIYIRAGGNFSLQSGTITLSAPTSGDYQGYLMYVATDFNGTPPNCLINGGADDIFIGAIYAPYCDITINGNSTLDGLQSQIIGYTVHLSGTAELHISYDPSQNPTGYRPPRIGLMR